ncbi:MAG: hypothetical protein JW908_03145 [Anaerolineales bacterium]|nr:hypothetical protein [Anaerolineales bacterium]
MSYDNVEDAIIQPDGKIIVVGKSGGYMAMACYNPDGILDTTFGAGGKANTVDVNYMGQASAVSLQNGGKIVLAGEYYDGMGNYNLSLVRYKGLKDYLPVIIR